MQFYFTVRTFQLIVCDSAPLPTETTEAGSIMNLGLVEKVVSCFV